MLDRHLLAAVRQPLQKIASGLVLSGVTADQVTVAGFIVGVTAVPLIITGHTMWALFSILLNSSGGWIRWHHGPVNRSHGSGGLSG